MTAPAPRVRLVGAIPRADLLPREIRQQAAVRRVRRVVVLLAVFAVVLVGAGFAGATVLRLDAQSRLDAVAAQTSELQAQQAEFVEVRVLQRASRQAEELAQVPLADRIDWGTILGSAIDALPASASVLSAAFSADSPIGAVDQLVEPFTKPRIGFIELNLQALSLEELADWLDEMRSDPTFSDVSMLTVEVVEGWAATATLSLAPELTAVPLEEDAE